MKSIGIFYGSSTGTTEGVAKRIAEKLGVADSDIHDVAGTAVNEVAPYEVLLLGSSTWGCGDLQDDWEGFLDGLKGQDLKGKLVGLFGCGDSASFGDTFCNAMGTIYEGLQGTGCTFIGSMDASGYSFDDSTACQEGMLVGLALDEMNEDDQTEGRMDQWIESLKKGGIE